MKIYVLTGTIVWGKWNELKDAWVLDMMQYLIIEYYFLFSFQPVSVSLQLAHSWVVDFQSQNRGHIKTRICPSNVFSTILYIPCLRLLPVSAYRSYPFTSLPPYPPPSPSTDTAITALAIARSSPSCSYHILATHAPGLRTVSMQRSIIVRVMM